MNGTLLKSEERTATKTSDDVNTVAGQRGVLLTLDVTKAPPKAREAKEGETEKEKAELAAEKAAEEGTLTLSLELRDPASGKYLPLTAFAVTKKAKELEAGATLAYTIYPGAAETAAVGGHEVMALALPGKWRVKVTHSAGGKWTYSVGATPLQ
jgi:hypothetical protein